MRITSLGSSSLNKKFDYKHKQQNPQAFGGGITVIAQDLSKSKDKTLLFWSIIESLLGAIQNQTEKQASFILDKNKNNTKLFTINFAPDFDCDAIILVNHLNRQHLEHGIYFKFDKEETGLLN